MATDLTTHTAIDELEAAMVALGGNVEFPVTHRFCPGIYMREIHVPAGHMWVTATHKKDHFYFMMKGKTMMFSSTEGKDVIHEAPCMGETPAGTRRVVTSVEDTIWVTVHENPTNTRDIEKLSEELVSHDNPLLEGTGFVPQFRTQMEVIG